MKRVIHIMVESRYGDDEIDNEELEQTIEEDIEGAYGDFIFTYLK